MVTPGNVGVGAVATELLEDLLSRDETTEHAETTTTIACGDNAYGTDEMRSKLEEAGIESPSRPSPRALPAGAVHGTVSASISTTTPSPVLEA